jgi:hypothetical protein
MTLRTQMILGLVILAVSGASLFPTQTVESPAAAITVRDGSGTPVQNVKVYRDWRNSDGTDGRVEVQTDAQGVASFQKKEGRSSVLGRSLRLELAKLSHPGTGTTFLIYCPMDYEVDFSEPDFTLMNHTGNSTGFKRKGGSNCCSGLCFLGLRYF